MNELAACVTRVTAVTHLFADDERPAALERIADLLLPPQDPVYGASGPMQEHWT